MFRSTQIAAMTSFTCYSLANISTAKDVTTLQHDVSPQTDESEVAPGLHGFTEVPEIQLAETKRPKNKRAKTVERGLSQARGRKLKRCHSSQSSTQSDCESRSKSPKEKKPAGDCVLPSVCDPASLIYDPTNLACVCYPAAPDHDATDLRCQLPSACYADLATYLT